MKTKLFFAVATMLFATCICLGADRVRFVEQKERQCYDEFGRQLLDANGRPTCVIVTKVVPVIEPVSLSVAPAVAVRNDAVCPCGCGQAGCTCGQSMSKVRYENPGAVEFRSQPMTTVSAPTVSTMTITSFEDAPVMGVRVPVLPRAFPRLRIALTEFRGRERIFDGRFLRGLLFVRR